MNCTCTWYPEKERLGNDNLEDIKFNIKLEFRKTIRKRGRWMKLAHESVKYCVLVLAVFTLQVLLLEI
jgi:hypothetical protein